jgi:hypothetical protein
VLVPALRAVVPLAAFVVFRPVVVRAFERAFVFVFMLFS